MAIASLPWYDLPETRPFTDAFWLAVRNELCNVGVDGVPDSLDREHAHTEQWLHPHLMFTQACGYDVATDHSKFLRVMAAPCFLWEGCSAHYYTSWVVVRVDDPAQNLRDLRGYRAAINNVNSHSGTNAFRAMIAPFSRDGRFFAEIRESGAHVDSLGMLARGEADVACVDCVTFGLLERYRPQAVAHVRKIAQTPPAPAPPYVTSMRYGRVFSRKLQHALVRLFNDPATEELRKALGLGSVALLDNSHYQRILDFEQVAIEHGYFELPAPQTSTLNKLRMRAAR